MDLQVYFVLLEKYDGNLGLATKKELAHARRQNPNNATGALVYAVEKFRLAKTKKTQPAFTL